jgi:hypothetical protein
MSSSGIPPEVQQQVLQDPRVQAEIDKAAKQYGQDAAKALQDPQVQAQIMAVMKEKGPQYAQMGAEKIKQFVSDPKVQEQAKNYASQAGQYLGQAGGAIVAQIEQGPDGVRVLAFIGGIGSAGLGIFRCVTLTMSLAFLHSPVTFVIALYQVFFGLTSCLFEASHETLTKIENTCKAPVSSYQDMLIMKAKFISESKGRGFFYVFQGTLWLSVASLTELLNLGCGLWLVFIGFLNLLIGFGGYQTFAAKVTNATSGYRQVAEA